MSSELSRVAPPGIFVREPFRVFFPLGLLAGIAGVLLWPLFYAGKLTYQPNLAHARVMVEGLFGAFVLGFLGTAFPRLVGARPLRWWELAPQLAAWAAAVVAHLANLLRAGDAWFAVAIGWWFAVMLPRFLGRRDSPPPGFPLALLGIGGGAVAAGIMAWCEPGALLPFWHRFLQLMLYQGFPLLPMLGIAPFLLPRFFGRSSDHLFPDSRELPDGWLAKAANSLATGIVVLASFALEAGGLVWLAHALRLMAVWVAFQVSTPVFRSSLLKASLVTALRIAVVSICAGYLANLFHPTARVGNLHLTLVSGFALFTLAVGTRVILGHGGRHDLLAGKLVFIRWTAGLALLASTTRMSADYLPEILVSHHKYAAWTWVVVSLVWFLPLAGHLLRTDEEELPPLSVKRRRCPKASRRQAGPDSTGTNGEAGGR
jgi:uncharacterized protein involved in response to NO